MATAYRCDRCGEYTDGHPLHSVKWDSQLAPQGLELRITLGGLSVVHAADLCADCGREFRNFMMAGKVRAG
jgi:NAD-dependent dihydropyrimidine dehydrogenase PreA subunit